MAIFKNKDVEANINERTVELGNINANFYTEDEGTASVRMFIKWNDKPIDLNRINMQPVLNLFMQDGSIFEGEEVEIILADKGLIQYKIPNNVIKHVGKVNAKLFLVNNVESIHVANFNFNISDSGVEGAIRKELSFNLVDDVIKKIVKLGAMELLDDNFKLDVQEGLQSYVSENAELFRGEKGEMGEPLKFEDLTDDQKEELKGQPADNKVVADLIKNDVAPVTTEVKEARGNYRVLNERLKLSDESVFKVKKNVNKELVGKRKRKPIMTFVDDDGRIENLEKWRQTVIDKKIPLSIALITSLIGKEKFLSLDQIYELKDMGVEFTNHTHNHILLGNFTEKEIRDDFEKSKAILNNYGLVDDILVYPGGSQSAMVREVAREYFRCAVSTAEAQNTPPLKTFSLNRKTLADTNFNTLEYYKQQVDDVVDNNGWLIWKSHSHYDTFDSTQVGYIRELIDYAREKGVEIVNMSDGLDIYGNIIDTGDYVSSATGAEYTILDNQGILHSKTNSKDFRYIWNNGSSADNNVQDFKTGKTVEMILSNKVTGFPENKGGILETYKMSQNYYSFQIYHIFDNTKVYKRAWDRKVEKWGDWYRIDATRIKEQKVTMVTTEIPANGFKEVVISEEEITNNDNIIVTPKAGLETGLMYNAFIGGTNNIRIRLYNMTSNAISINRPFKLDIIKQ